MNFHLIISERMRENPSERETPSARNLEPQWKVVKGRKPGRTPRHASKTCFVNHLPLTCTSLEIAKIFRTHGCIDNIYIPAIRDSSTSKFAFVKFQYPQSLPTPVRDENGRRMGPNRITVYPAKFDKPSPSSHRPPKPSLPPPPKSIPKFPLQPSSFFRDSRSYKEVTNNAIPKPPPQKTSMNTPYQVPKPLSSLLQNPITYPFKEHIFPEADLLTPNPSKHRIMNSRVFGEDTKNIRNSLGAIDLNGDYAASLKGSICEDNTELFQRSVIGVAISPQSSHMILDRILSEGVNCLSIKPMGGMLHLISFEYLEDKIAILESKWLEQWFMALREVNENSSTLWRETEIKVYGVPLVSWSYENFYNIGNIFGKVTSVNYQGYECAQIHVLTNCLFEINCKIALEVQGDFFPIYVSEYKCQKIHAKVTENDNCEKAEFNTNAHAQEVTSSDGGTASQRSPIIAAPKGAMPDITTDNLVVPPVASKNSLFTNPH